MALNAFQHVWDLVRLQCLERGDVLIGDTPEPATVHIHGESIQAVEAPGGSQRGEVTIDANGALVLPGIVDLHGDAFERAVMPRAGVFMPVSAMWSA